MRISTNLESLNTHRSLTLISRRGEKVFEKLSSGYRINRAGDDAAGLAISEKMRAQIRGLTMASKNVQDGISMIQTAEGALAEIADMVQRIRELTVQGASDTYAQGDRNAIAEEVFQLTKEIRKTEDSVDFNGMKILKTSNGAPGGGTANPNGIDGKTLQVGANSGDCLELSLNLESLRSPYTTAILDGSVSFLYGMHSMLNHVGLALRGAKGDNDVLGTSFNYTGDDTHNATLGYPGAVNNGITGLSQTQWISRMVGNVDAVVNNISTVRASLGAMQNRLEHKKMNLDTSAENLCSAEARIRDVDMAKEMMEHVKVGILSQTGIAMLSQANHRTNTVLSLLG